MKKYASLLALVLVIALAVPASAAISLNGSISSTVKYEHKTKAFTPSLSISITPGNVSTPGLIAFAGPWVSASIVWEKQGSNYGSSNNWQFAKTSYMSFKGQYTTGGQEVTTRIGYLGKVGDLHGWVPNMSTNDMNGISITGAKLAGGSLDLYYNRPVANTDYFTAVSKKDQFVNKFTFRLQDSKYRYRLNVNNYPVSSDLKAYGYVDYDTTGATAAQTWQVGANYKASPEATFDGKYNYNETYDVKGIFNLASKSAYKPTVTVGYKKTGANTTGVYADAIADVQNMKVGAKYDQITKTANLVAGNMFSSVNDFVGKIANPANGQQAITGNTYGAALTFVHDNDGKVTSKNLKVGTTQDLVKLLNLETKAALFARVGATLDLDDSTKNVTWAHLYGQTDITTLPGFAKITAHGRVTVASNAATAYGVGAAYTAPNGVAFKAGYNWNLSNAYNHTSYLNASGFVVQASKSLSF